VDNRHEPGDCPEDKVERPRCGASIGQRSDMEVCRVAEEHAGPAAGPRSGPPRHVGCRSLTPVASRGGPTKPLARPGGASNADDQKAGESFRMRPDDDGIAEPVRPFKREQEEAPTRPETAPTISAKTASTRRLPWSPSRSLAGFRSGVIRGLRRRGMRQRRLGRIAKGARRNAGHDSRHCRSATQIALFREGFGSRRWREAAALQKSQRSE